MSSAQSSNILGPLGRTLSDDVLGAVVATARVIGALVLLFFLPGFLLINALYPRNGELLTEDERDHRVRLKLQQLAEKREALRRAIKDAERRMRLQSADAQSHYETARDKSRAELRTVEAELKKLEEERAAELY